jgi:hypothetical protein
MDIKRLRNTILAGAALLLSPLVQLQAATTADILFVVDESGSMSTEHAWIGNMVGALDTALTGAGVSGNQYGLIGFGGSTSHGTAGHKHTVGSGDFGTAAELATATSSLVLSGRTEDGYSGIDVGLNNYAFRSGAAVNVILITDEDRDILSGSTNTYANILGLLQGKNALLNAVVNARSTSSALGIDGTDSYFEDGTGFTKSAGGVGTSGAGTTLTDYVNLALASGGGAWDLNKLRAGGVTATAFTAAFVDLKVAEIIIQPPVGQVPIPAAAFLFAPALLGFLGLRRKAKNNLA